MSAVTIIQHRWTTELRPATDSPIWQFINNPVDLIFADPPYNYGVDYQDDVTGDELDMAVYQDWTEHVVILLSQMVRDGGTLWWLCPAEYGEWVWPLLARYGKLLYGKPIIWHERFSQYQRTRLTSDYRMLYPLRIGHQQPCFNPDDIREPSVRQQLGDPRADPAGRVPGHVWQVRRLIGRGTATARVKWHPVQLAPEPLGRIVLGWTNPGDCVLDAFAGSGSMGLVCKRHERNFVGVDGSATYCKLLKERLK